MTDDSRLPSSNLRRYRKSFHTMVQDDDGEWISWHDANAEIEQLRGPANPTQQALDAATKPLHIEIERLRMGLESLKQYRDNKREYVATIEMCAYIDKLLSGDSSQVETTRELCPNCGKDEVGTFTADQWFLYGREQFRLLAKDILFFRCMACGLEYTGEDGESKRMEAVRAHLARSSAQETSDIPKPAPYLRKRSATEEVDGICEALRGMNPPEKASVDRQIPPPTPCTGCEGKPEFPNIPCSICGMYPDGTSV